MSQAELGDRLSELLDKPWTRQAVWSAEKGARAFTAAELVAIAEVLDYRIEDLFAPTEESDPAGLAQLLMQEGVRARNRITTATHDYRELVHASADRAASTEVREAFERLLVELRAELAADPRRTMAERGAEFIEEVLNRMPGAKAEPTEGEL
ncbi:hypothetical protein IEE94_11395 [Yimella sp. cx-573]|nr:hypothetical protein [Yimella sp. cx-573]